MTTLCGYGRNPVRSLPLRYHPVFSTPPQNGTIIIGKRPFASLFRLKTVLLEEYALPIGIQLDLVHEDVAGRQGGVAFDDDSLLGCLL